LATQTGGDLWLEASRNDELGTLQRASYARARAILATNPWAYANARRFGFRHVLYVPLIIDTEAYAPGPSEARAVWQSAVGGDFFVLVMARLDRKWKGSHIGLDGFASFAARHPNARLVLVGWGEHSTELVEALDRQGLQGRYVCLPISGKRRLVDYLRGADCALDQFVMGYYGATALEALSTGVPVVMRLARDQYDALCPTGAPPVLDATTAEEVDQQLQHLAASADTRARVSALSRQWVQLNHGVDVWRDIYVALLNAVAAGALFDFRRSPLARSLSRAERAYHEAGLRSAPPFPHYNI
jgi:glycosyltransferase involved in cell wall biosynthesis